MQKKIKYCLGIAVFCLTLVVSLFFITGQCEAVQQIKKYNVDVPAGETIDGPVLAAGKSVVVDGTVNGDLYVFGSDVKINGTVKGDLLAAAANITINGVIEGNLRTVCGAVNVSGRVEKNISLISRKIDLAPDGVIGQSLLMGVLQAELQGTVNDEVSGWGLNVVMRGDVGEEVNFFKVADLTIDSGAKIGGGVRYVSTEAASISSKAEVAGVGWDKEQPKDSFLSGKLLSMAAGLLIWWPLNLIFPGIWNSIIAPALNRPFPAVAWGITVFFTVPLIALLLLFTVVGVPLALMVGAFYAAIVFMGKIIAGCTLGCILARRFESLSRITPFAWFLIGYAIIVFSGSLPFLGVFINMFVIFWTFGVLVWASVHKRKQIMAG